VRAEAIAKALGKFRPQSSGGFVSVCPAHEDSTPSLSLTDADDGKVLVHCHAGCDQGAVVDALKRRSLWPTRDEKPAPRRPAKRIERTYDYVDPSTGEVKLQVVRYEPKDFRQRRPDGAGGWSWSVPASARILFNLPAIAASTGKAVCICEGEKDVEALSAIGVLATCNPGGAGKWQPEFNEPLRDRDIIILPDNDAAGEKHADVVLRNLHGIAKSIRVIRLPNLPAKGDVSDWLAAGGSRADLTNLYRSTPIAVPGDAVRDDVQPAEDAPTLDTPFRPLGFNAGTYYYLSTETQQVTALTGPQHSKMNLFTIAPMRYWEREFPAKNGADYDSAADTLMRMCAARGIFSPEIMRGRGAWYDTGRVVLHMGDRLYVDKQPMAPIAIRSAYVYERGLPMTADIDHPATLDEARQFLELIQMLPWATDMDALYVAGWCALAHIGGVLPWRPHVWIVGSKGSGKSHVMSQVVRPMLGENCLFVVSETTEAGVRQSLRHDALPVLFDEAEGDDQRSVDRLQRILALVRQSSSETGGKIAKGTVSGNAMSFQVRSCFAFSSINASLVQQSDRSRVTVVELKQERQRHSYEDLLAAEAKILTDGFVQRFYARAISMASIIRANALVFARAVAAVMGEQRAGDQIGTLLAGAWSLRSDTVVTFEEAAAWVAESNWDDTKADVQGQSDERSLLDYLLQQVTKFQEENSNVERTIGELIDMVRNLGYYGDTAAKTLGRLGFKWESDGLLISNTHDGIKRLLRNTPWSTNWSKVLRRLPGAKAAGVTYFGYSGSEARSTWVRP
jgi:putative DNA primase/helicase